MKDESRGVKAQATINLPSVSNLQSQIKDFKYYPSSLQLLRHHHSRQPGDVLYGWTRLQAGGCR